MKQFVFEKLPPISDFGPYNENNIAQIGKRSVAIHNDANTCLHVVKRNTETYIEMAEMIMNLVLEKKINSIDHEYFFILCDYFYKLKNQFDELAQRYDYLEHNFHTDAYVRVSLNGLSDSASLGFHDTQKNIYNANFIKEEAEYIFENMAQGAAHSPASQTEEQVVRGVHSALKNDAPKSDPDDRFEFVKSNKTFKDVAGLKEVKEDLMQIVDFIKRPNVYKEFGAKLPKGTLFAGPPGTGKTLLARAVAGEANVKFIAIDSTVFCSSRWGEAPQKINELFTKARKNAPCIIFIDEIDMLGLDRNRDKANSLAHRESLNAFLAAMDGFDQYEGITVIAATNMLNDLDPALTRPGRFDNIFTVPLPSNIEDVQAVVEIYMKNKKFDESITSLSIARKLLGNSPASIEVILNKACLLAIRNNGGVIREVDFNTALTQQIIKGHIKPVDLEAADTKKTALHEAGHALVAALKGVPVRDVSVLPTSTGAGGLTTFEPLNKHYYTKADFEARIMVAYAGRCSEQLAYGVDNITTGASADIKHATQLIKDASSHYGFNLSGNASHAPILYSSIKQVDLEKAANKYYGETLNLLKENYKILYDIAKALLETGTISGETVTNIVNKYKTAEIDMEVS